MPQTLLTDQDVTDMVEEYLTGKGWSPDRAKERAKLFKAARDKEGKWPRVVMKDLNLIPIPAYAKVTQDG